MSTINGPNLPTTDPRWIDQRMLDGKELTPDEQKISEQQLEILRKTNDILNQPVRKGDMKAARARVDALKEQFESLSPEMKQFLYCTLQTDMGKKDLSGLFHYKLSSISRDKLLKALNPDHKVEQIKARPLSPAEVEKTKASMTAEKNLEGMSMRERILRQEAGNQLEKIR